MTEIFNPLVSIVIPVYNGSNYLRGAIDSTLDQTYKNIEVLVINDGSSDNGATKEIALSYGDKIRYFEKQNGGVASALNFGITKMKGEYFSWLSHDDIYYCHKIEKQIDVVKSHYCRDIVVFSDYELLYGKKLKTSTTGNIYSISKSNHFYGLFYNLIHGSTILIPAECFKTIGLFNEELRTTNDYELFYRLGMKYKFVHLSEYLVKVRIHDKQDSLVKNKDHFDDCNTLWINFLDTYPAAEILKFEKTLYLFYARMVNFLKRSPYKIAFEHGKNKLDLVFKDNFLYNSFIRFTPVISGVVLKKKWFIRSRQIRARLFYKIRVLIKSFL